MNVESLGRHVERVHSAAGFDRIRFDGRFVGYIYMMDGLGEVLTSDPDACDLVAAVSGVRGRGGDGVRYIVSYGLDCEEFGATFVTYGEAMDFAASLF